MGVIIPFLRRRCPKCLKHKIFENIFKMYEYCPECNFKYEREPGYYTGAMFINWFLVIFTTGPIWITMMFTGQPLWKIMTITTILLILQTPFIIQYSRIIWLYLDYHLFDNK